MKIMKKNRRKTHQSDIYHPSQLSIVYIYCVPLGQKTNSWFFVWIVGTLPKADCCYAMYGICDVMQCN